MKTKILCLGALMLGRLMAAEPNTLTEAETAAGWRLLWDGRTTTGWHRAGQDTFPDRGWSWDDGTLTVIGAGKDKSKQGGSIVADHKVRNFELQLDFRITAGANSGILYMLQPNPGGKYNFPVALEYQILDDERHGDAKKGRDGNRKVSALYDLIPAHDAPKVAPGEWHTARVLVDGAHVEHWLDGVKVLEFDRSSPEFAALVVESKFASCVGFGDWAEGELMLQDHGDTVSFRSIKLRDLP